MALVSTASDASAYEVQSTGIVRRFLAAIIKAREAQAEARMVSQLRDHLPEKVLKDIGISAK
jgi:hypothetical protein